MHTQPVSESDGEFKDWKKTDHFCGNCKAQDVYVRVWESSDGAYEDYQYKCKSCGHTYWIDGIDS